MTPFSDFLEARETANHERLWAVTAALTLQAALIAGLTLVRQDSRTVAKHDSAHAPLEIVTLVQATPSIPIVTMSNAGKLFLNGYPTNIEQLKEKLPALVKTSGGVVGVRTDGQGDYSSVMRVMDAVKQAGGERLALGTRPVKP